MIERDPLGFAAILLAMLLAVYVTRAGGFWLMGRFPIGPRLRRMLDAMPGAVIAATVAPILITGGLSAWLAVATAAITMILLRNDFAAVVAGVAVAAAVRAAGI
jgi:uncharacterized membrane protein